MTTDQVWLQGGPCDGELLAVPMGATSFEVTVAPPAIVLANYRSEDPPESTDIHAGSYRRRAPGAHVFDFHPEPVVHRHWQERRGRRSDPGGPMPLPGPLVSVAMDHEGRIVQGVHTVDALLRRPRPPGWHPEPGSEVAHHDYTADGAEDWARRRADESTLDTIERVLSQAGPGPGVDALPHDWTPDLCWRCNARREVNHVGACGPCRDAMRRPGFLEDFASGLARLIERNR